ncbi:MAG: DUF488 domain-containing protein [Betaproteobacteria bacterium]|nr:DUF488 domain-containing protein [Betaproteobacteria bacterium]
MIRTKRVYEPIAAEDGARYLVERLWPRGVKKEALGSAVWLKDVAPSDDLRRWFNHDPVKWVEFRRRYQAELDAHPASWEGMLEHARAGNVTLLYSAHDGVHNNANALKDYLVAKLSRAGMA